MTLQILPALSGLTWDITKNPLWSTRRLEARSGLEYRAANWSFPRWKFTIAYSTLRTASDFTEYQQLVGFINSGFGQFSPFWYNDTSSPDNSVTDQPIGSGNGTQTIFPLVRSLGGFAEPITYAPTISNVSINGVSQIMGTDWNPYQSGNYGNDSIQFTTAPASAAVITASFTYYFTCCFTQDETEFNNFINGRFEVKTLSFESLKA